MHIFQRTLLPVFVLAFCASVLATAQTYMDVHDFDCNYGCSPGWPDVLAQGRDGSIYGTMPWYGHGMGDGTAFSVAPSGSFTLLHNFGGSDGGGEDSGLTLATDGYFYGANFTQGVNGYGIVFKMSPTGTLTKLHDFSSSEGAAFAPPIQAKTAASTASPAEIPRGKHTK